MREMKDSGMSWVGEIPKEWRCLPIRALFTENRNKNFLGRETKALQFRYGTIIPKKNLVSEENYVAETILNYNIVDRGMIMLNGLNLNFDFVSKRIALVTERGIITSAYVSFYPTDTMVVSSEYASYLLKSYDDCAAFHNMGGGVRKILNFDELKRQYFVLPPIDEQRRIAEFLDGKCGEIDEITKIIEEQIETLENYKRSLITETVTKGLDKSAKMKDSGIAWIGEIPEHWETIKGKYLFTNDKKVVGAKVDDYERLALTMKGVIKRSKDDNEGLQPDKFNTYQILGIDELVFKLIDLQNISTSRVGLSPYTGIVSPAYIIIKSNGNVLPCYAEKFYLSLWMNQIFNFLGDAGVRSSLNAGELLDLYLPVPPISEQRAIAEFLDGKCGEIDEIIAGKQKQLETLKAYKQSVIYEYVTGKKEVPNE